MKDLTFLFAAKHSVGMYRSVEKRGSLIPCISYGMHPLIWGCIPTVCEDGGEHLFLPSDIPYGNRSLAGWTDAKH